MGYFIFNDTFMSKSYGIEIEEVPKITKPQRRADIYSVPGRSGNIIVPQDAWEDVQITYHCWANPAGKSYPTYASSLAERLQSDGYAELVDGYTGQHRLAYFSGPIEFDVVQESFVRFDLTFMAHPQIYLNDALTPKYIPTDEPLRLTNDYGHDAYPLFQFMGSGTLTITYEDRFDVEAGHYQTQTITVTADSSANDVYLDCETGAMYMVSDNGNKTRTDAIQVSGTDLPILRFGAAVRLQWSNSDNLAYIIPRWWQL